MKFNKLTKTLCVAGILAAPLASAQNLSAGIAFTTVPDVSIIQLQALDMGGDMSLTLNNTCTLVVSTAANEFPSEVDLRISDSGAGEGTNYQTRTGNCDNAVDGTAGIYEVTGGAGVPVKISVNSVTGTAFNFTPTGMIAQYDGATTNNGDSMSAIVPDSDVTVNLANVNDVTGAVAGGAPQAGKTLVVVGGTLTAAQTLTAGQTYTEQFTIDVIY